MEITRDKDGRYVAQLYLSKLDDGATASVVPKEGYSPSSIPFTLNARGTSFLQGDSWRISNLDGGWRLLDGLIAAVGRPAQYTYQIKNNWGVVIYDKPTNQIPQQVKDYHEAVKGEIVEFSLLPPDPNSRNKLQSKGGVEFLAAQERFNQNSVGKGGKTRNKTNKKNKKKKHRKTKRRRSRKYF